MVNIECCWTEKGIQCKEEADPDLTGICPWGDFCYCPKHEKLMMDQYIAYVSEHPPIDPEDN